MQPEQPRSPPASYRPGVAHQARVLCRLGMTDTELAGEFRIAPATLDEWLEVPEFAHAVWEGRSLGDGYAADGLHRRAVGCSHDAVRIFLPAGRTEPVYAPYLQHYPPHPGSAIHWLERRRPENWRPRTKLETEATHCHDIREHTDDELDRRIAELSARRAAAKGHPQ